jgi:hypothetical protein
MLVVLEGCDYGMPLAEARILSQCKVTRDISEPLH